MTIEGSLATYHLIDLLQWVEHHLATGRLVIERESTRRTIDLSRGRIVFVSSNVPRERLGTFLVERKVVTAEALYEAFARHYLSRQPLTRVLADAGALNDDDLRRAMTELAEKIIFKSFSWTDARFHFDPDFRPEPLVPIQLSLEAQILAFRGAKELDDTSRRAGRGSKASRAVPASPLRRVESGDDAMFWAALERASSEDRELSAGEIRERQAGFHAFVAHCRLRSQRPPEVFPVFGEVAAMLHPRLLDGTATDDFVLQLTALDPYLTANLLLHANSLTTDRAWGVSTPREALATAGSASIATLLTGMTAPDVPMRSADDALEAMGWRAALSQAVAAAHLAEFFDVDREEAYFLALLGGLAWGELLPMLLEVPLPSRAFRLATLEQLQPEVGRKLADRFALPNTLTAVMSATGGVNLESPPFFHMLFLSRELAAAGANYGLAWRGEEVTAKEIAMLYDVPDQVTEAIREDSARLFDFLGLAF